MAEYIEREAALEAVKKEREYAGKFSFEEERAWTVGFQQGVSFALSDIAAVPSADVAPVRHGQWKEWNEAGMYMVCPSCGEPFSKLDVLGREQAKRFCSNCGAKMGGGET